MKLTKRLFIGYPPNFLIFVNYEPKKSTMKQTDEWTTVTLFISSTFADMDAERDHIRRIVIPQLEEFFNPLHVAIRVIDLRWGVNTTDDKSLIDRDAKILKVCMEEIDRSRPFFIGLLGSRYGWVPDNIRIKRSLPQLDIDRCRNLLQTDEISVTALEFYYGLFEKNHLNRSIVCIRNEEVYRRNSRRIPKEIYRNTT